MNKIITSMIVFSFVFSLGLSIVSAEENTATTTNVAPATTTRPVPMRVEAERRKTIRDTYQDKLNILREKYQENKNELKSTTTNASSTSIKKLNKERMEERKNLIQERLDEQRKEKVRVQAEKIA